MPWHLIFAIVVAHIAFSGARLTLSLHGLRLGGNTFELGLLTGLLTLMPMFFSVRLGRWADAVGMRAPAVFGLAVLIFGCLLGSQATGVQPLFLGSILIGSGYVAVHVAGCNAVGQHAGDGRVTAAFSVLSVGFSVSAMVAPLIAGVVIDLAGAGPAYLVSVGFALASAIWIMARAPAAHPHAPAAHAGQPRPPTRTLDLLGHRPLRPVLVATALLSLGWDLFLFLAPLHGTQVGLSATAVGGVMAAFALGTLALRLMLPRLERQWSAWSIVACVLMLTAVCYVVFPLLRTLPLLLPAAFLMGAALGCAQPLSMTLLHHAAPPGRGGETMGLRSALASGSQTLLPIIFGAIGAGLGLGAIFWANAVALAAGATLLRRHVKREQEAGA